MLTLEDEERWKKIIRDVMGRMKGREDGILSPGGMGDRVQLEVVGPDGSVKQRSDTNE